jgi:hypothetical protein
MSCEIRCRATRSLPIIGSTSVREPTGASWIERCRASPDRSDVLHLAWRRPPERPAGIKPVGLGD